MKQFDGFDGFDDLNTYIFLHNNTPVDDFLGLSASEIHTICYEPLSRNSIIQYQQDIDNKTLDQIPLFRIVEEYLRIIQRDKQIKLTPKGALPRKIVEELYNKRILPELFIERGILKLWREEDCISIMSARLTAEIAGFVKKVNGKLTLTKSATKLLDTENRVQIFKQFFQAFTDKFNWSFNDRHPQQPIGQFAWLFSIFMLNRFGGQPATFVFYAEKYLKAFPHLIKFFKDDYTSFERQFYNCYGIRVFERFILWFGLATVERKKKYLDLDTDTYTKTDLVKSIFKFDK